MKNIILIMVLSVFSVALVNAQTDTTKSKRKSTYQSSTPAYPTRDMKKISSSEIPASLRTTLQGSEYNGWENATMYYNSTNGQYSYQVPPVAGSTNAVGTKNPQWYHFDKTGTRLPDPKP